MRKCIPRSYVCDLTGKDMQSKLDHALHDVHGKFRELEEAEKSAVRKALIEERSRFCLFVTALRPFVVGGECERRLCLAVMGLLTVAVYMVVCL